MNPTNHIFIGGTGRSGTNILKAVLATHTSVAALPFEYRFSIDPRGIVDFYNSYPAHWSPYRAEYLLKELEDYLVSLASQSPEKAARVAEAKGFDPTGLRLTPPPYAGWELEKWMPGYLRFVQELMDDLLEFDFPGVWPGARAQVSEHRMYFTGPRSKDDLRPILGRFMQQCVAAFLARERRSVFVEDNTHNILFASDLLNLVPLGRLIHVVRDPRDVIASLVEQRWAPTDMKKAVRWYEAVMSTWLSQRQKLARERYFEMKFEDFVADPTSILEKIGEFTGLKWDGASLNVDLSKHNIGRYKLQFTSAEIAYIENELRPIIRKYGYHLPAHSTK